MANQSLEKITNTNHLAGRIEQIAVELTTVLSVVETEGEVAVSEKVYDIFSKIDYYRENPNDLKFVDVEGDFLGRKNVCAILRGKKNKSQKQLFSLVILILLEFRTTVC